ncbi:MAG: amino acid ABC transporter substrate-binding protein [Gammaproteobacteria bacterium]|nr:MAG: amino acid ABC transporter substrate-binding protein [Gammaproteobacteria bacterium]
MHSFEGGRLRHAVLTLLLLIFIGSAHASQVLRVGYADFPPYEYSDQRGEPIGSFIEITRKVLKEAGFEAEFVALPVSRIYLYLKEGRIDFWPGLAGIPDLQDHVLESRARPIRISLRIWHTPPTPAAQTLSDLVGKRLIVINGYTYSGLIYRLTPANGFELFTARTHESALQMLVHGRGDYLLDYTDPILETLKHYPVDNLQSTVLRERLGAFLVSRKHKHAEAVIRKTDQAYESLIRRGEIRPLEGH